MIKYFVHQEAPPGYGQPRKVAYHPDGTRFGTIDRGSTANMSDTVTVQFAISHDGNLRVVME